MQKVSKPGGEYNIYDFNKVWRFLPLNRPRKELLKGFLFAVFPFLFRKWAICQNWKNSRVFRDNGKNVFCPDFWRHRFFLPYKLHIPKNTASKEQSESGISLAVVIHVFYPDIFREILLLLKSSGNKKMMLFITTPHALYNEVKEILTYETFRYHIEPVENRGRDILPFLKILPRIFDEGYQLVLKIHTKNSEHLLRSNSWRQDLIMKLIGDDQLSKNIQVFQQNRNIGIVGPAGHILPMSLYYGANASTVKWLCNKMELQDNQLHGFHFVAGSMFFALKEALQPLLKISLTDKEFEPEENQLDGTMAHAMERAFSASMIKAGLILADTSCSSENGSYVVNVNHSFTI